MNERFGVYDTQWLVLIYFSDFCRSLYKSSLIMLYSFKYIFCVILNHRRDGEFSFLYEVAIVTCFEEGHV